LRGLVEQPPVYAPQAPVGMHARLPTHKSTNPKRRSKQRSTAQTRNKLQSTTGFSNTQPEINTSPFFSFLLTQMKENTLQSKYFTFQRPRNNDTIEMHRSHRQSQGIPFTCAALLSPHCNQVNKGARMSRAVVPYLHGHTCSSMPHPHEKNENSPKIPLMITLSNITFRNYSENIYT
jgi:hypothetical protein